MAGIGDTLREIHRLRRHARDLQQEIDRGPIQLKAHRAKAAKVEEAFRAAQEELKKLKVTTHENEVTLKATHGQIAKYERQLDEAADKKQYDALKHEIAVAREKAQTLEDAILEGMGQVEDRSAKLPEQEQGVKQAQENLAAFEKDHAARLARLADQLRGALNDLKAAEERIPEQWRPQYQRIVNAHGADALAAVQGHACAHCHTQITVQQLHDIQTGEFICCRACGRGLYMPE
jgi:predicted  nucleic acid-binding Zn-ribbon protein